jgi:hypothetical protein
MMSIPPETLAALHALREAVPKLAAKLQPSLPHDGLITEHDTNEWGIPVSVSVPSPSLSMTNTFPDTDPRYWQTLAVFDETGCITSLLVGGQRLLSTVTSFLPSQLLDSVVTLDLAGTDLPVETIAQVLKGCPRLARLYLGGNALGDAGMTVLTSLLPTNLEVLDVRYNDIGTDGAAALARYWQTWEKVYLEGNCLGDAGAIALSRTGLPVRELYLGQNDIGPDGAAALAEGLRHSKLEKLYLEGNHIGAAGAAHFQRVLEELGSHKTLEKLYVENNNIEKTQAIQLGNALNSSTMIGEGSVF